MAVARREGMRRKLRVLQARSRLTLGTGLVLLLAFVGGATAERVWAVVFPQSVSAASATVATVNEPARPDIILAEQFSDSWPNHPGGTAWFANDGYRLVAREPGRFVAVRSPLADAPPDVIVSGRLRKVGGPPGGGYGVIVADQRTSAGDGLDQSGDYVVAAVGDRGEIGIWRRHVSEWVDLLPWTSSPAVRGGTAANDVAAHLIDGHLTLSVNGQVVATVATGLPPGGGVGLFTGGDANAVAVERFSVAKPAAVEAPLPVPAASRPRPAPSVAHDIGRPGVAFQRIFGLLEGIARDIGAIYGSFANGPNSPNPVTDPTMLKDAARHLDSATDKAYRLAHELDSLRPTTTAPSGDGR